MGIFSRRARARVKAKPAPQAEAAKLNLGSLPPLVEEPAEQARIPETFGLMENKVMAMPSPASDDHNVDVAGVKSFVNEQSNRMTSPQLGQGRLAAMRARAFNSLTKALLPNAAPALPKGTPERGRFITQHMSHAPFIGALQAHPQGKTIHTQLTSFMNSKANAGPGGPTKVTVQGATPIVKATLPVGATKDTSPQGTPVDSGKVKIDRIDGEGKPTGGTSWTSVRSGKVMNPDDGRPASARNPTQRSSGSIITSPYVRKSLAEMRKSALKKGWPREDPHNTEDVMMDSLQDHGFEVNHDAGEKSTHTWTGNTDRIEQANDRKRWGPGFAGRMQEHLRDNPEIPAASAVSSHNHLAFDIETGLPDPMWHENKTLSNNTKSYTAKRDKAFWENANQDVPADQQGSKVGYGPNSLAAMRERARASGLIKALAKTRPTFKFPKMGFPDDRRETPVVTTDQELSNRARGQANRTMEAELYSADPSKPPIKRPPASSMDAWLDSKDPNTDPNEEMWNDWRSRKTNPSDLKFQNPGVGVSNPLVGDGVNYLRNRARNIWAQPLANASGAVTVTGHKNSYAQSTDMQRKNSPYRPIGSNSGNVTKLHEDLHQMLGRVQQKHGQQGRVNLVTNLLGDLKAKDPSAHAVLMGFAHNVRPDVRGTPYEGEEALAHLISYLNSPSERNVYHYGNNHDPKTAQAIGGYMKRAYKHLNEAAKNATSTHVLEPSHLASLRARAGKNK